ncbi:MAG: hypothetical protein U0791_06750 [Gemmataceae bacterium]
MDYDSIAQTIGNVCVALAAFLFLLRLRRLLRDYASQYLSDNRWTRPVLITLIPVWLLLMGALLCMTAGGGFDSLSLSRPVLYALTVAASVALATVNFVFIALYIRPGFTPRAIYTAVIYLVPLTTALLAVLSLNQKNAPGDPIQWLRRPWTLFAALCLVVCAMFFGRRLINRGFRGLTEITHRILNARNTTPEHLAKIATLNPQSDFAELLELTRPVRSRVVCKAATARLRTNPAFVESLAAALESRNASAAMEFVHGATLSPEELKRLALPTRTAIERFITDIPAANYIPRTRQKELLKWGRRRFPVIIGKFSSTDIDFSKVMPAFENALRAVDSLG